MRQPAVWILLASLSAAPAGAFTRSRDPDTRACLWWETRQVRVLLNEACSADLPRAQCETAVWASLAIWNEAPCSDFQFLSGGLSSRTDVGFDEDHWDDNVNLILWTESSWRHDETAIAMTTTTYDRHTGQVVDTDVELNGLSYTFTAIESPNVIVDIQNTLAHEAGHMLGLDHSSDPEACMFATAPEGETKKRDLAQDDIDGVCHIYPTGQPIAACPGGPAIDPGGDGGCGQMPRSSGPSALIWLLALGAIILRSRTHVSDS
ncbi:MAG: matrixin family metalloprotease [Deltaproteobacteria bacterium]|nr:matrixin family metalloprotease [Deltaproteobacteria bacterium]